MHDTTALLLIDIQNDYFPGGRMELAGSEAAAHKAATLLNFFREHQLPVLHIAHESIREGATFFLPGTPGQRIHARVEPLPGEQVIGKNFPNSFVRTALLPTLQQLGATHLLIAGMMTHMCVDATTRAAVDLGFSCTLVHDAVATRDLAFGGIQVPAAHVQAAFLAALSVLCTTSSTDEALQVLSL